MWKIFKKVHKILYTLVGPTLVLNNDILIFYFIFYNLAIHLQHEALIILQSASKVIIKKTIKKEPAN